MKWTIMIGVVALTAMLACKSTDNTITPTNPAVFGLTAGAYFEYTEFQVDSSGGTVAGQTHILRSHVLSTGLTYESKTNVAMMQDSVLDSNGIHLLSIDTIYLCVESGGKRFSQYGFVASLVKRYSMGSVTVPSHWNLLVALDTSLWLTDTTSTSINFGGVPVTVTETVHGMTSGSGRTHYTLNAVPYETGEGTHSGTVVASIFVNAPISFTVDALFSPTGLASVRSEKSKVASFSVPEYHRVLLKFKP